MSNFNTNIQHKSETINEVVITSVFNVPQGIQGPPVPRLEHIQEEPSDQWEIYHELGYFPHVTVIDDEGNIALAYVNHQTTNFLYINFGLPFTGTAILI